VTVIEVEDLKEKAVGNALLMFITPLVMALVLYVLFVVIAASLSYACWLINERKDGTNTRTESEEASE